MRQKIRLVLSIWTWLVRIRLGLRFDPLPLVINRLGGPARLRADLRYKPAWLGRVVGRILRIGPWEPTCLLKALILYRLLREQGDPAEVVIGLPESPRGHIAHAWVELNGVDLGPFPGQRRYVPLARFG